MPYRPAIALAAALALLPPAAGAADGARCIYSQVAHFPVRYSGPGLDMVFDGEIDGTAAPMLADTGSYSTFMTMTGVLRRKLALRATRDKAVGVGGESAIAATSVRDFALGPVHSGQTDVQVLADTGEVPSYDAIVGVPFLMQADLEVSLPDKMLRMYRASDCGDAYLALWDGGAIDVPFLQGYRSSVPVFNVRLNGVRMHAILDTGAGVTTVSRDGVRFVGVKVDMPGVTETSGVVGIGGAVAKTWTAQFDSFSIGSETIKQPRLTIVDRQLQPDVDVVLGRDFLRAHRVLFAISQGRLYLAYAGGEVFPDHGQVEPWMQREADSGNTDAQYAVALRTAAAGDKARGMALLEKAAQNGSPYASEVLGKQLLLEGRFAQAEPFLKTVVDKLPSARTFALHLFLARLAKGEETLGRRDLAATFDGSEHDWPAPIADYYLGRSTAAELLSKAAATPEAAAVRTCEARTAIYRLNRARGDQAGAEQAAAPLTAACSAAALKPAG